MKILVLSFYHPPDLCAGSFRISAFLKALNGELLSTDEVVVLTTMPNRYKTYSATAPREEQIGKIKIVRFPLPSHKSGFFDQGKAFGMYAAQCLVFLVGREFDVVFATSSRLFTAFLGAIVSRWKRVRLYIDIRDIFPDTMNSLLPSYLKKMLFPFLKCVEKLTLRSAFKVNLVSRGFEAYFRKIVPNTPVSFFYNGIDNEFLGYDYDHSDHRSIKIVTYAGNIGQGQGLEFIIPEIAKATYGKCFYRIIGDGGRRDSLVKALQRQNIRNVELINPVNRGELLKYYKKTDYLFLHLNSYEAFYKVLPSKVFEYAATGKPIIAGVCGFASDFIEKNIDNSMVFRSCDAEDFLKKFKGFNPDDANRKIFINSYKRSAIMNNLAKDFLQLCGR